jgi:hypothetical protein
MAMVVEYLVTLRRSDTFCDSVESFNRLLGVDSNLLVADGSIQFKGVSYGYHVKGGEVAGKEQRYFHLRFSLAGSSPEQPALDDFSACLKAVRVVIAQAGGQAEILWDDISSSYSCKAYPLIQEIENLMRKLIANFMLITVGREWVKEAAPGDVKIAIDKSKRKADGSLNILHTLDFCHLGDFLFSKYSTRTTDDLYQKIGQSKKPEDLDLGALKDYLPRSNWQRYFSALVSCEDGYLSSRWNDLYELRCLVAHNGMLTKDDLQKIERLVSEVKPKLVEAIKKLPSVSVPADEMEAVAESAVRNISESLGCFITVWQHLEALIVRKAVAFGGRFDEKRPGQLIRATEFLSSEGVLDAGARQCFLHLRDFRNRVVHGRVEEDIAEALAAHTVAAQALIRSLEAATDPTMCPHCKTSPGKWSGNKCMVCGFMTDD